MNFTLENQTHYDVFSLLKSAGQIKSYVWKSLPIQNKIVLYGAVRVWIRSCVTSLSLHSQATIFRVDTKLKEYSLIDFNSNREALVTIGTSIALIFEDSQVYVEHSDIRGVASDNFSAGFQLNGAGLDFL